MAAPNTGTAIPLSRTQVSHRSKGHIHTGPTQVKVDLGLKQDCWVHAMH
jgi:hypothetical protein